MARCIDGMNDEDEAREEAGVMIDGMNDGDEAREEGRVMIENGRWMMTLSGMTEREREERRLRHRRKGGAEK